MKEKANDVSFPYVYQPRQNVSDIIGTSMLQTLPKITVLVHVSAAQYNSGMSWIIFM